MHVVLTGTCCCGFQVTAPQVASLNLAFAADDQLQGISLNRKTLPVEVNPTPPASYGKLEGRIKVDAGSSFFMRGTNTLRVNVLNVRGAYGFYAKGTAITGAGPPSPPPLPPSPPPSPPPRFTTDLTTGIAAGWSPPTTFTNNGWYQPGEGKWLGNTGDNTGDHNKVHEYTLSFEVNPRASLSRF